PGEPYLPELEQALKDSETCVVFIGPSGIGNWQQKEVRLAIERQIGEGRRVVPVLLPSAPRLEKDLAPNFLLDNTWVDFRKSLDDNTAYHALRCGIQGQRPGEGPESAVCRGECPYPGLVHFDISDARLFFGRENRTQWLLEELRLRSGSQSENRFVAIIGSSGSGKSSLARAGLLAGLQQGRIPGSEGWPIVVCRPGQRPLKELARALCQHPAMRHVAGDVGDLIQRLRRERDRLDLTTGLIIPNDDPTRRVVVFVDQFEELFTLCTDEEERQAYADNLWCAATEASGKTIIVLTMRADFYGACAAYPQLAALIGKHQELLPPMNDTELRRAIELPAQLCGVQIDPGLPRLMLRSMQGQGGALPLLQHALRQLWERGHGSRLSMDAYLDMGELQGALQRHAEAVFERFSPPQQEVSRAILCSLTKLGERTEDTKRSATFHELLATCGDPAEVRTVVNRLADERLVTTTRGDEQNEPMVEVAHEALIRGWTRLRDWLDQVREAELVHQHLTAQAEQWENQGRNPDFLYSGGLVLRCEQWAQQHPGQLTPQEDDFLTASVAGLVQRLGSVELSRVPQFLEDLEPFLERARDPLLDLFQRAPENSRERLCASAALLPLDAGQVEYLRERLLAGELAESAFVRELLHPRREELTEWLWSAFEHVGSDPARRFRAGLALAAFDPLDSCTAPARWDACAEFLAARLVDAVTYNPAHYHLFEESVRPVRRVLIQPLTRIFQDESDRLRRAWATTLLVDLAHELPETLVDLACEADPNQFAAVFDRLHLHKNRSIELAQAELNKQLAPTASEDDKEMLAKRQANAAVILLRLRESPKVWPLLRHTPDPRRRSYLVHRLQPLGVDSAVFVARLDVEPDVSARRALVLALGELFPDGESFGEAARAGLPDRLEQLYRDDPDPGIHGAVEWVLRRWSQVERLDESVRKLATGKPQGDRQWYVNGQGQTLVVIPGPIHFAMGSLDSDPHKQSDEVFHYRTIARTFAICDKAVAMTQYKVFQDESQYAELDLVGHPDVRAFTPTGECPVTGLTWYEAAAYCNWLSMKEGITRDHWCYEPNPEGKYGPGMRPKADYLSLHGYRLPSEAEWEYACRACAETRRYYGHSDELLASYAWYDANAEQHAWPVGSLKPNDFGLFDMHGNVWNWCHNRYRGYGSEEADDTADEAAVDNSAGRVLRGGSFDFQAQYLRAAYRVNDRPGDRDNNNGFRVARTYN
ncbi:MAG TPA: SUMF1/EgtB/PvdO family nonheme iron enzyme, partial [Pirellulales bacterium]|nr:SUMF1/EgtB/PvdO family nonheme iron enzyme [Pirellulales bacterium]